jgi:hypothetical protein
LDWFMGREGYTASGGHYNRPNGTRGPAVRYGFGDSSIMFAVDHNDKHWIVSGCWAKQPHQPPIELSSVMQGLNDALYARRRCCEETQKYWSIDSD